jgi:hypothetical protein
MQRYDLNDDMNGSYMSESQNGNWLFLEEVLQVIEQEPEYPDPCPKLREFVTKAIEDKDVNWILHMLRQTVRQTKQSIIARIQTVDTESTGKGE